MKRCVVFLSALLVAVAAAAAPSAAFPTTPGVAGVTAGLFGVGGSGSGSSGGCPFARRRQRVAAAPSFPSVDDGEATVEYPPPPEAGVVDMSAPDAALRVMNGNTLLAYDNTRYSLLREYFGLASAPAASASSASASAAASVVDEDSAAPLVVWDGANLTLLTALPLRKEGVRAALARGAAVSVGQYGRGPLVGAATAGAAAAAGATASSSGRALRLNRVSMEGTPSRYTHLKMAAHTVLMTASLLDPTVFPGQLANATTHMETRVAVPAQRLAALAAYTSQVRAAQGALSTCCGNMSAADLTQMGTLLELAVKFHTQVQARSAVSLADLYDYANQTAPHVQYALYGSAEASLTELDALYRMLASMVPKAHWERVRVISDVSHMARTCEEHVQYFIRQTGGTPMDSGYRVINAENIGGDANALRLFATHLIDFTAGRYVFHNPDRMHRDILAVQAAKVLDSLLPNTAPLPQCPPHEA